MNTVTYYIGQDYPDLELAWRDDAGELRDFSDAGWAFTVTVRLNGSSTDLVTKITGITGYAPTDESDTNVIVDWSTELNALQANTYDIEVAASLNAAPAILNFTELVMRVPGPAWGYCEVNDLLIGDESVSTSINRQSFVNGAADEINGKLGKLYVVPVVMGDPDVADWVKYKLSSINVKLASGRLQQALHGANADILTYGKQLIDEANDDLRELLDSGDLPGVPKNRDSTATAPAIWNHDETSAVDAFENFVMRGDGCARWNPGRLL